MSHETPKRYTKEQIRRNRQKVAGTATALLLTAGIGMGSMRDGDNPEPVKNPDNVCVVTPETHEFVFAPGQGINDAVHSIKGSGNGEGDPCWDEARESAKQALDGGQPQYGQTIKLPDEIHPISNADHSND